MGKIRLKFKSVAEIVGSADVALITLTDELEQRQLTIVCDQATAHQLSLRANRLPIANTFLPEVLLRVMTIHTELQLEILITGILDGQYKAIVYDVNTLTPTAIRISDAVLLSVIGPIPLYIDETLMRRQSVSFNQGTSGIAIPVNTLNGKMLDEALQKAIDNENYELASHLRDEIRRRKAENPTS